LRQRRVAAGEDQTEAIVPHGSLLDRLATGMQQRRLGVTVIAGSFAPEAIDGPVAGGCDDPSRRARR
jgi:hypothetical protein